MVFDNNLSEDKIKEIREILDVVKECGFSAFSLYLTIMAISPSKDISNISVSRLCQESKISRAQIYRDIAKLKKLRLINYYDNSKENIKENIKDDIKEDRKEDINSNTNPKNNIIDYDDDDFDY